MTKKSSSFWKENRSFIIFLGLMFVFRSAVADWNDVPTGSMKPTIIEGDRIFVNKMAYDLRVPFTHVSMTKLSDPQRNDIVIFDSVAADKRLVKRVIGVPGDKVAMYKNRLTVNGQPLEYELVKKDEKNTYFTEKLAGSSHTIRITNEKFPLDSFEEVIVPEGSYLVMGDNRNESADSRVYGFVPRNEIVGRSKNVAISFDYDNYLIPRSERFLHTL